MTSNVKDAAQSQEWKRPVDPVVAMLPVQGVAGAKDAEVAVGGLAAVSTAKVGGDEGVAGGDDVLLKSGHGIVRVKDVREVTGVSV